MEKTTKTLIINSAEEVPSLSQFHEMPRSKSMILAFVGSVKNEIELIGESLRHHLEGFMIGINTLKNEISISRLITEKEIEDNQIFFEACAKDYRNLATELINKLANQLKVSLSSGLPRVAFCDYYGKKKQGGIMGDWHYFFHGHHCWFGNKITGQEIEVPLVYGLEFGELDPYFFCNFIKTTTEYSPLPVEIDNNFYDGKQILKKCSRWENLNI